MNLDLFDFHLPEELIAQTPLEDRSSSRLLAVDRETGAFEHKHFSDILSYIEAGDTIVVNDTKVMPARLFGTKEDTGASIEVLLLKESSSQTWETLVKPAKRIKVGTTIVFGDGKLRATCIEEGEQGGRTLQFSFDGIFYEILDELGEMPLPPYIKERLEDKDRYQTVYAKEIGSAAAPTAGLHFTEEIMSQLREKGVTITTVTLHVGLGTFRPVSADDILEHKMHSEYYTMSKETATILNETKARGGRIIAVGTTSARTIETIASRHDGTFVEESGWTSIFIYPGYSFKGIDGLITNFHLPKSTLLMLVSALSTRENMLNAYNEAVKEKYRFFSFGDAMLII